MSMLSSLSLNSGDDMNEEEMESAAYKIGAKVITALSRIFWLALVASFGLGVYLTTINMTVSSIAKDFSEAKASLTTQLTEVKEQLVEDHAVRLRRLENQVSQGILPKAERRYEDLETRLRALERNQSSNASNPAENEEFSGFGPLEELSEIGG
jgi:BMFP domain-containing protein YqiC